MLLEIIEKNNLFEQKDYQDDNDDGDEAQDDDEDSNSSDDIVSIQEAIARGVEEIENNEDLDYQEDNYWE